MITAGTATTHTFTVTYTACKDNFYPNIINGSISAGHTIDAVASSESATVTITNLTDTIYTSASFTQVIEILALNGTFVSSITGTTAGRASALGTFGMTFVDPVYGNMVMSFNFGSGSTPITDTWTRLVSGGTTTTETHTANGSYGLSISMTGAPTVSLGIALANLVDAVITTAGGADETISGSISIGWTPDLSEFGCLNGTYVFTTIVPIHYVGYACPTAGQLRVNNAVIEFGNPLLYNVRVTLDSGPTEVFADCYSLGGDMCGSGGAPGGSTAVPPSTVP